MNDIVPLSDAARRFAEEYLIDFKAAAAAERAGLHPATGHLMLKDFRVDALIREGRRKISERVDVSIDNTIEMIRNVAQTDTTPVLEALSAKGGAVEGIKALPENLRVLIKSFKMTKYGPEVTFHDRLAAVQMLGKYFGLFVERVEHTGKNGGPIEMVTPTMTPKEAADAYAATLTGGA